MFTNDSRTENFLTQLGVLWKYTNSIRFSDLRPGWESRNLARPVPIRDEAVEEYASLMQSGSAAPGPIVILAEGGMDILDGVQRIAASQLSDETTISAYVVTCDSDDLVAAIRILANARLQGRAEPLEWTRRKAVEVLIVDRGMSVVEVAKMGGWRPKELTQIAEAISWRKSIVAIGGPDNLPDSMLSVIATNTTQDDLHAAADVAAKFFDRLKRSSLSAADAEPFVGAFFKPVSKKARAYQTYQERLKEFECDPEIEVRLKGRKGGSIPIDVNLRRALRAVVGILGEIREDEVELKYIDEFFQITKQIHEKLHELSDSHKKRATHRVPADMYQ